VKKNDQDNTVDHELTGERTIGKKTCMTVSGLVLFAWLIITVPVFISAMYGGPDVVEAQHNEDLIKANLGLKSITG